MRSVKLIEAGKLILDTGTGTIRVDEETVKVQVKACAICGSDLALYRGYRDISGETYFGHEFSGVITEVGNVSNGMRAGMRVASELVHGCGRCWFCRNGQENYCRSMNYALMPGGFTEETLVRNLDSYCFLSSLPDELDDVTASLLEPANCAFRIAMRAEMSPGDSVVVFGMGAMGLLSAMILKTMGAGKIVLANLGGKRLENVKMTGLFETVSTSEEGWEEQILDIVGREGADIVIEATGAAPVLKETFKVVRLGGRIVVGGVYSRLIDGFDPLPIFRKELTIVGAKGPSPQRMTNGASAVVEKLVQLREGLQKIITVYEYRDALKAFEDAKNEEVIKAVIQF